MRRALSWSAVTPESSEPGNGDMKPCCVRCASSPKCVNAGLHCRVVFPLVSHEYGDRAGMIGTSRHALSGLGYGSIGNGLAKDQVSRQSDVGWPKRRRGSRPLAPTHSGGRNPRGHVRSALADHLATWSVVVTEFSHARTVWLVDAKDTVLDVDEVASPNA